MFWSALTIIAGGFVAGTHAGLDYNTFPLMEGSLVPPAYARLRPFLLNLTENIAAVQFDHRLLATLTVAATAAAVIAGFRADRSEVRQVRHGTAWCRGRAAICLGVLTLLYVVPPGLAVLHQGMAVLALTAALNALHAFRAPRALSPAVGPG